MVNLSISKDSTCAMDSVSSWLEAKCQTTFWLLAGENGATQSWLVLDYGGESRGLQHVHHHRLQIYPFMGVTRLV